MTGVPKEAEDDGSSLIELLMVIVILGILATTVVFAVVAVSDDAEDSACRAGARTLEVAAEGYLARHPGGTIPATPATSTDDERFERTLVEDGLIRRTSEFWDVSATGALISIQPC